MALTKPYAIKLGRALEPLEAVGLEEFLPPDDYEGYKDVKAALPGVLLSTAEHEYTRYGFRRLLRSVDILQPDVACRVEIKLRCQRHA